MADRANMDERDARGTKGFLLWSFASRQFFFRIYDETNKGKFRDYRIDTCEIEVEIIADPGTLSFYEDYEANVLDFSSKVLGHRRNNP